MNCTWCSRPGAEPRRQHGERVLCDACADKPPIVDYMNPPAPGLESEDPNPAKSTSHDVDLGSNGHHGAVGREAVRESFRRWDARLAGRPIATSDWLEGEPVDPLADAPEPLPIPPGVPFAHEGAAVLISAPTGSGKSYLVEAVLLDSALAEVRCAFLSGEVTPAECNARAADIAARRGDALTPEIRSRLAEHLRYLDLGVVLRAAWEDPERWATELAQRYQVVAIDPTSAVASALDLDFDKNNAEYVLFHDRLIKPLVDRGMIVLQVDNIGHAFDARGRAKGVSAKQDKADVVISCASRAQPAALMLKATKVRSVRAPFHRGDAWTFDRETLRIQAVHDDMPGEAFKPTGLMERVSRALEEEPGLSRNGVRAAVKGKASYVDLALELLVSEGFVNAERDGQSKRHSVVNPYRVPESLPGPDRVPDPVAIPGPPGPALLSGTRDPVADTDADQDRAESLLERHADLAPWPWEKAT